MLHLHTLKELKLVATDIHITNAYAIMNRDKHIWEGWTVGDFIDELELTYKFKSFESKFELKNWVKSEQPYYKKHIPEVYNYFLNKSGL
jgi:hypothetical protein